MGDAGWPVVEAIPFADDRRSERRSETPASGLPRPGCGLETGTTARGFPMVEKPKVKGPLGLAIPMGPEAISDS